MSEKQFFKDFFIKDLQVSSGRCYQKTPCRTHSLQKQMRSLHTLIRTTRSLFTPNIVCCLETNFLNLISFSVTTKRLRMFQLRNNSWQAQSCAHIYMGWAFIFEFYPERNLFYLFEQQTSKCHQIGKYQQLNYITIQLSMYAQENMKVSALSGYSWSTHINGMYVCVLGIPKCKFSKQMIKKYLVTEYLLITEGKFLS